MYLSEIVRRYSNEWVELHSIIYMPQYGTDRWVAHCVYDDKAFDITLFALPDWLNEKDWPVLHGQFLPVHRTVLIKLDKYGRQMLIVDVL